MPEIHFIGGPCAGTGLQSTEPAPELVVYDYSGRRHEYRFSHRRVRDDVLVYRHEDLLRSRIEIERLADRLHRERAPLGMEYFTGDPVVDTSYATGRLSENVYRRMLSENQLLQSVRDLHHSGGPVA